MGLSDDERYSKAFYTLNALRKCLLDDWSEFQLKQDVYVTSELREAINKLDDSARQLTGMVLQWFDSSGTYWLFGESEGGFRGNHSDYFWGQEKRDEDIFKRPEDEAQVPDLHQFAKRLGFDKNLVFLAKWWELYSYVPALLYAINRYEDKAFSEEFKSEFNRLMSYVSDLKPVVNEQAERVLLLKYKLFYADVTKGGKNLDYEKQDTCLIKYREMDQFELDAILKAEREDKWKKDRKYNEEQAAKRTEKVDPVYGKAKPEEVEAKPIAAKSKKRKLRK